MLFVFYLAGGIVLYRLSAVGVPRSAMTLLLAKIKKTIRIASRTALPGTPNQALGPNADS
jgi:hypothetical protein